MQKILLTVLTSVLFSTTFYPVTTHADITLDLGGYFRSYAGYTNQDNSAYKKFDMKRRSQLYFMGQTTIAHDMVLGYYSTLLQENSPAHHSSTVERSYLYLSDDWGRINLGREAGAATLLQMGGPSVDSNIDGYSISFAFYDTTLRQDYEHVSIRNKYAEKITYITPKMNGLQAAFSFAPDDRGRNAGDRFGMPQKHDTPFKNIWDIAARYEGDLNGITLQSGAGFSHASADNQAAATPTGAKDRVVYNFAAKAGFNAWSIGGGYLHENSGNDTLRTRTWSVGTDYTIGAYTIAANYFNTKNLISHAALDRYTFGGHYTLAEGVKFAALIGFYNANAEANNNDATTFIMGTDIRF